jgi:hypothetical protein
LLMDAKLKVIAGAAVLAGLTVVLQPLWTAADPSIPYRRAADRGRGAGACRGSGSFQRRDRRGQRAQPDRGAVDRSRDPGAPTRWETPLACARSRRRRSSHRRCHRSRTLDPSGGRGPSALSDEHGLADVPLVSWDGWLESADERWASVLETARALQRAAARAHRRARAAHRARRHGRRSSRALRSRTCTLSVTLSPDFRARACRSCWTECARASGRPKRVRTARSIWMRPRSRASSWSHAAQGTRRKAIDLPQTVRARSAHRALTVATSRVGEWNRPGRARRALRGSARRARPRTHARSGLEGSFGLQSDPQDRSPRVLTALAPGKLPARIERTGASSASEGSWP